EGMHSILSHPPSIGVPQGFASIPCPLARITPRASTTGDFPTLVRDNRTKHRSLHAFVSLLFLGIEHFSVPVEDFSPARNPHRRGSPRTRGFHTVCTSAILGMRD